MDISSVMRRRAGLGGLNSGYLNDTTPETSDEGAAAPEEAEHVASVGTVEADRSHGDSDMERQAVSPAEVWRETAP